MIRAAILGASGYVGGELLRLLVAHPGIEVERAFGASAAGRVVSDLHPHLGLAYGDMAFDAWDPTLLDGVGEGADDVLLADDLAEALGAVTAVEGG